MSVLTLNVATGAWTHFSNRSRFLSVCWNTQTGHLLPAVSWLKVNVSVLDMTATSQIHMTVFCDAVVSSFVFGFVNNLVWLTACLLYYWNWKHSPVFPPLCAFGDVRIDVCGNFFPQICGHLAVMWWWRVRNARIALLCVCSTTASTQREKMEASGGRVCQWGVQRLCGSPDPLICRRIKRSLECLISRCSYKFMYFSRNHLFRLSIE